MKITQLALVLPASPRDRARDDGVKDAPSDQATFDFLTAPMILHGSGGWDGGATLARCAEHAQHMIDAPPDVPDWLRAALPKARAAYLEAGGNPALACELDAVVYLMTASLAQPLGSEWTRIYLHAAFNALRALGHVEIPDEEWVREADKPLSRDEARRLDELRSQIRQSQRRRAKTKRRGRAQVTSNESEANHEST